jgi:two-component system response regulator DesR
MQATKQGGFYLQCSLYVRNNWTPATLLLRFMPGVLIADDNANIRVLLRTFIENQTPFKVCAEAKSGVEAIEKAKEFLPDVALLDLAMPDLNGIEVASVLKAAVPGIKLILFTMKVDGLGKSLASAIGIDFVLSKEESITKLTDHLKSLIPASAAAASPTGKT